MCGQRDESLVLDDLVAAVERLLAVDAGTPAGELGQDRDLNEIILWNLIVLGEASKRLWPMLRTRFGDAAWSTLARTRDKIAHHYEGIDWSFVTEIIQANLPLARLIGCDYNSGHV